MNHYLIKGGRVIDPAKNVDKKADVLIKDGKINKIGTNLAEENAEIINAKGLVVCPGLIDLHVHFREPGREDKETIETGLKAALVGGVTSVLTMPNTNPVADNQTVIEYQLSKAKKLNLANLYATGTITSKEDYISEMNDLKQTGAVALTDDGYDVQDEHLFRKALEWAKTFKMPVLCHAEVESLTGDGVMNEGAVSTEMGLPGIPHSAEDMAIMKNIMLAEDVGTHLHISHIATERGVEAVRQAKKRKIKVTAEVTPHHFALTDEVCRNWNTNAKMYPPLRTEADKRAVIKGLQDGSIDIIATDHAPHLENEKLQPFVDAPKGTVGLETLLAVSLTYLVKNKKLTLSELIKKLTINPANLIGIDKGQLAVGKEADITLFDPNKEWIVDSSKFESKGKNSVFNGYKLFGQVNTVLVSGVVKVKGGRLAV